MSRRLATPKTAGAAARFGHGRNRASARHCSARWCRPLRLLRAQARTRASQSLFAQQICWDEPTPRLPSTKSRRPTAILRHPSEWMVAAYCAALFASDYLAPQAVRPHSFSMQPRYANSDRQNDTPQKCLPVDNGLMNRSLESCTKWRAQLAEIRSKPLESTTHCKNLSQRPKLCGAPDINSTRVPRAPASRTRFATCPDLLVENPKAEIAPPAAQERI